MLCPFRTSLLPFFAARYIIPSCFMVWPLPLWRARKRFQEVSDMGPPYAFASSTTSAATSPAASATFSGLVLAHMHAYDTKAAALHAEWRNIQSMD